jgi:hypothetical protein
MSLLTGNQATDKGSMTRFFEDMLGVQFSAAASHTEK